MSAIVVSAFVMGLLGGAHCVAMCGGVSSMLCSAAPRSPPYVLAYNAGRIACYTLLGLLLGALGSLTSGPLDGVRFFLRALAALCMLAVGLHLIGLPSLVKGLERVGVPLWRRVAPLAKKLLPLRSPWHALGAGLLWGLMPCGLLYGALALAASADSPEQGALTMAAFGAGTLPLMLTIGALASVVARGLSRPWVRKLGGAVVLGFGIWSVIGVAHQVGWASVSRHHCCPR